MRKSVKREYELDRCYDYAESYGFKHTNKKCRLSQKRSHRRLRKQILRRELQDCAMIIADICETCRRMK